MKTSLGKAMGIPFGIFVRIGLIGLSWILAKGIWNDDGIWKDTEKWND